MPLGRHAIALCEASPRSRRFPRTSKSGRSLHLTRDSRFGLAPLLACGHRCRSRSHTSEWCVLVRRAMACNRRETNDIDCTYSLLDILVEMEFRLIDVFGAHTSPFPRHQDVAHEGFPSRLLPG